MFLTDDYINMLSEDNVLTTYKDTNEQVKNKMRAIPGGVYDSNIFGSCFSDSCNCGKIKVVGKRCPECGSRLLSPSQAWLRYARIDLPFYYCSSNKVKNLLKWLMEEIGFVWKGSSDVKIIDALEYCQWGFDEESQRMTLTDDITDCEYCSYDGLLLVIKEHFESSLNTYRMYVNKSILVTPVISRPPMYTFYKGEAKLNTSAITQCYKSILYAIIKIYPKIHDYNEEVEKSMLLRVLRTHINKNLEVVNSLLYSSKANSARCMQSNRIENSGRATIIPNPDLKVDEVAIPRHLAYEAFGQDFRKWLESEKGFTKNAAKELYKLKANSLETRQLFDEYIETCNDGKGKYVIINRNPTLYELGMQACRVVLTNNYTIGIPMLLCESFNADFDGDTMSFYSVPDELTDQIISVMSPKNLIYYKKNHKYLYMPKQDIMRGLVQGCRVIPTEGASVPSFETYEDAYAYRRKTRGFKWQSPCIIANKETTLARYKFGEIFNTDIDALLGGYSGRDLKSSDVGALYEKLVGLEDRTDRMQQAQELALNIATISGASAPKLSEMYSDLDTTYLDRIREIESDSSLSDEQRYLMIDEIYKEFRSDTENGTVTVNGVEKPRINTEVRRIVTESARAKMIQLLEIIMNRRNITAEKEMHISSTTLLDGMSYDDWCYLAIENRSTQDIKQNAVPKSGYLTRQLVFIGSQYYFHEGTDDTNKGIKISAKYALGRTLLDGTVVDKSMTNSDDELVVRSVVTSTLKDESEITTDMVSREFNWKEGSSIGISLMSSMTEMLTQSGLALKHGGALFEVDKNDVLKAPFDGELELTDKFINLVGKSDTAVYPRPVNFIQNSNRSSYKKGDTIGWSYNLYTPSYRLDQIIKLMGAKSASSSKRILNNKIQISECYALNSGILHYKSVPCKDHPGKTIVVEIDGKQQGYNPNVIYNVPDGAVVEMGQRICSGVFNIDAALSHGIKYVDAYYLFRNQYMELFPELQQEIIEFLFSIIVRNLGCRIKRHTINTAVADSPSLYTRLSFENSRKTLRKIDVGGYEFVSDSLTNYLFPMLFNADIVK